MSNPIIDDDLESLIMSEKHKPETIEEQENTIQAASDTVYTEVELPSKGRLGYPDVVEYRDILVRDEKMLASSTEKTFPKVLNRVIKGLLKDQSFFDDMTIHDRDFLLMWIWANNYSTIKTIEAVCPVCDTHNRYDIDLTKLEVTELSEKYKNPYPYTLKNGTDVSFRLITVRDEEVARKFCNSNPGYEEFFVLLCMSVTLDKVMSLKDKINWIENNMSGRDMSVLRGFHKFFKYGINDVVEQSCKSCGEVSRIAIPFQVDFFIPTLSSDFGPSV